MDFKTWKELPYVKEHWVADDFVLKKIFKELSEEEKKCMFDSSYPRKWTRVCQCCANAYRYTSKEQFETLGYKDMWNHIRIAHPSLYDEVASFSDEEMLEECYKE